ncbi:UNVERIFIED_CONTAM: hypothetical protein Sradi_5663500 [Sesamum radiatum]|uniref:Uncharacterized protein n=1 Tax=Sesamum radiatum TaxID=300843 RepID=A0AAW2L1G6_SESRA
MLIASKSMLENEVVGPAGVVIFPMRPDDIRNSSSFRRSLRNLRNRGFEDSIQKFLGIEDGRGLRCEQ